jgi:hypothetical protein
MSGRWGVLAVDPTEMARCCARLAGLEDQNPGAPHGCCDDRPVLGRTVAFKVVAGIDRVGRGALDPALTAAGYPGTQLAKPQRTTATDVATILTRIWDGSLVDDPGLTAELRGHLVVQQVNDRLSLGPRPNTPFAHNTGDRTGWAHDAGIITAPTGDYLVVLLTGPHEPPCCHAERPGPAETAAFTQFAAFANRLFAVLASPS